MKSFSALAVALSLCVALPTFAVADDARHAVVAQDIDIRDFIRDVAAKADLTVIVDPRVQGAVSVSAEGLSRDGIVDLFVSTLRAHGVTAAPSVGGAYYVYPTQDLIQRSSAPVSKSSVSGAVSS